MGGQSIEIRELSPFKFSGTASGKNYSSSFDIGDAVEVHGLVKITSLSAGTIHVNAQTSVDGNYWAYLGTTGTNELKFSSSSTSGDIKTDVARALEKSIARYLRFEYYNSTAETTATFEVHVYVKTRS